MKRILAALVVSASLLSACATSGGNDAAPEPTTTTKAPSSSSDEGPTPTVVPEPGARTVDWSDCGGGFQCGTIDVPLDYSKPDGKTIEVAVTRHPADDQENRIGTLFVNPGGPGGSAIDLARGFNRAGGIGDRFDIVGFDPRGVGESTPLDCHSHLMEIYDIDQSIDSEADRTAILEGSQAFVDECEQKYGDILPFLGTTDAARDMDEIRKAIGDEQLSYLGYSYGTSLGQEYARQFPTHVRSMILDGVVDHEPDGLTTAETQAAGFETALDSYLAHCDDEGCGFGDQDPRDVIDEVVAAAEKAPIPAPGADRAAGPGVVTLALSAGLYNQQFWSQISSSLRNAQDGDGSGLVALADQYLTGASFEGYFAVGCLDDTWPTDPDEVLDASVRAEEEIPNFGGPIVSDYVRCAMWPASSKPLKPVPATTKGLPPILVVSTTKDPATPYENGVAVAKQIPGAVLVTNEGEGHTVVNSGKPCIDDLVREYLVDLTIPSDGTTCD
ncbi:MAG: Alpha/beta hydrolase family protein [Ilumatobacteraceae bacterium]|nr:Alpha/beta hydrolase family protein [Ilumatobacteraceae bacterium]